MTFQFNGREAVSYVLLPGIIPRVQDLLRAPFGFLAALFAVTFEMAGLLPRGHRYTRPDAQGTFGMLAVLRTAAQHLIFDLKHFDQILIFLAVLTGWVSFLIFLILGAVQLVMTPALAGTMPESVGGLMSMMYQYTATPHPEKDIALTLLDHTLGILGDRPGTSFFGSDVPKMCPGMEMGASTCSTPPPFPSAFHQALHQLLGFYSFAIFFFAVLFFLYLVSTVVMETTITGSPLGKRMNKFWAPLRLVAALGLLVPMAPHGLNSAQYIVLYTGKVSSAFATNGWLYYNQILDAKMLHTGNPVGMNAFNYSPGSEPSIPQTSPMAAKLGAPPLGDLVKFLHLVAACEYYYERADSKVNVQGYFVRADVPTVAAYKEASNPFGSRKEDAGEHVPYEDALAFFKYKSIRITFGILDPIKYEDLPGGVLPVCGEMVIPVTSVNDPKTEKLDNPGAAAASKLYYDYVMALLDKTTYPRQLMDGFASQMIERYAKFGDEKKQSSCRWDADNDKVLNYLGRGEGNNLKELGPCYEDPPVTYLQYQIEMFQSLFQALVNAANAELAHPQNFTISEKVLDRGWAGAGIWYQKVAVLNGDYVSAVAQTPYGSRLPQVMMTMDSLKMAGTPNRQEQQNLFRMLFEKVEGLSGSEKEAATAFTQINKYLKSDQCSFGFKPDPSGPFGVSGQNGFTINGSSCQEQSIVMRMLHALFGTQFLFDFLGNSDVHPLTQLVTFGRALLESSGRNLMTGSAIAAAGGLASVGNEDMSSSMKKTANFYLRIANIMFAAGFMLFYVLPMFPFLYFFFAMLSWVKAIFEALIGAPLWALAHLRLDGNGFPSKLSRGGYLLLMEILLRPIITVFALIGAMSIFAAMMTPLNDFMSMIMADQGRMTLVDLASQKVTPNGLGGLLDEFYFIVLYILLVYIIAQNSFKFVDKVPNGFMRWFGSGVGSFASASRDEETKKFTSSVYMAVVEPARGQIDQMDERVGEAAEAMAKVANDASKGQVKKAVQQALGPDRKTTATEKLEKPVKSMTARHIEAASAMDKAKKALANAKTPEEKARLKAAEKEQKMIRDANDVDLLYKEILNPGKSGMSPEVRELAQENLRLLRKAIEEAHPYIKDLTQTSHEASGGVYADKDMVNKNVAAFISQIKKATIAEAKKK